ncbi:Crp/Fnr family transcriptional regulator [Thermodesulfobacteriota bacterium]
MNDSQGAGNDRMKDVITDFLTHFSFFEKLDTDGLLAVAENIQLMEMEPGEVLFREGDKGDTVYFVVGGELEVIKETVSGREVGIDKVTIATLSKGRSIGEMSVIDNTPRSATVCSLTKSILIALPVDGFDHICNEHPKVGIEILKGISRLLSMNMRKTSSRLADYMLPMG